MSDVQEQYSGTDAHSSAEQIYQVGKMDCANCAKEVEAGVRHLEGVDAVRVDFIGGKLYLRGSVDFETLRKRVESLGKTIHIDNDRGGLAGANVTQAGGVVGFWRYLTARRETVLALIGGGIITITLLASLWGIPSVLRDGLYVGLQSFCADGHSFCAESCKIFAPDVFSVAYMYDHTMSWLLTKTKTALKYE